MTSFFLFDHSCGHDKQWEDGLNIENMSKTYGRKQHAIQQSVIEQEHRYLDMYEHTIEPRDTQTMTFQASDSGPFWMAEQQREETRKDRVQQGEMQKKKICKAKLIKML